MRRFRSCRLLVCHLLSGVLVAVVISVLCFRQQFRKHKRISNRDCNHTHTFRDLLLGRNTVRIGKGAERVDGGVGDNAGKQASATIKQQDKQEADRDCKDDLTDIFNQGHTAAVYQIDDMTDTKGHAGNNNCFADTFFGNCLEQETSEDHFLKEPNAEHGGDTADRTSR